MKNGVIIDGVRFAFVEPKNLPDDGLKFCDHCALQKICRSFSEDAPCHIFKEYDGKLFVRVFDVPKDLSYNEVRIYVFTYDKDGKRKDVYKNTIKLANGNDFPFDSICSTFSLLYPNCEIEFIKSL